MADNTTYPVDNISINENRSRITAAQVCLLGLIFPLKSHWLIPAFLLIDFFIRGFGSARFSPTDRFSGWLVIRLAINEKPVDQAPKTFAAQLGFLIADIWFILCVLGLKEISYAMDASVILFYFFESAFGFCTGCLIYSLLKKWHPKI